MAYETDLDVFQYLHSIGYGQHTNNHSQFRLSILCIYESYQSPALLTLSVIQCEAIDKDVCLG